MGWNIEYTSDGSSKKYWTPETLPELTEEYKKQQESKRYLLPDNTIRNFPGWYYDENKAPVGDDYLFYNEGWKLIIDNKPTQIDSNGNTRFMFPLSHQLYYPNFYEIPVENRTVYEENSINEWIQHEKIVEVTYTIYNLIDGYPWEIDEFENNIQINHLTEWKRTEDNKIISTYTVTPKTEYQKKVFIDGLWADIRDKRNRLLSESDHYVNISVEQGKQLHQDFINYRQRLRDFPKTIDDLKYLHQRYKERIKTLDYVPMSIVDLDGILDYPQLTNNIFI